LKTRKRRTWSGVPNFWQMIVWNGAGNLSNKTSITKAVVVHQRRAVQWKKGGVDLGKWSGGGGKGEGRAKQVLRRYANM